MMKLKYWRIQTLQAKILSLSRTFRYNIEKAIIQQSIQCSTSSETGS